MWKPCWPVRTSASAEGVKDPACLSMTTESLTREFPLYTPSLLNLVKTSETRVKGLGPEQ